MTVSCHYDGEEDRERGNKNHKAERASHRFDLRCASAARLSSGPVRCVEHVRFDPESGHVRCNYKCLLRANSGHGSLLIQLLRPPAPSASPESPNSKLSR